MQTLLADSSLPVLYRQGWYSIDSQLCKAVYLNRMDKKQAYQILGIFPDASREDAKKAFRSLAKAYHPDRRAGEKSDGSDARMKEINIAYRLIAPDLKPSRTVNCHTEDARDVPHQRSTKGVCSVLKEAFARFASAVRRSQHNGTKKENCFKSSPQAEGKPAFDAILKSYAGKHSRQGRQPKTDQKKTARVRNTGSQKFQAYLKMHKRYRPPGRKKSRDAAVGAVGPVTPVSRINPVAGE